MKINRIPGFYLLIAFIFTSCQDRQVANNVISTDISNFWQAYDLIVEEEDSLRKLEILDSLYFQPASIGLDTLMVLRSYSAEEYVQLIESYPKYWSSLRNNTLKSEEMAQELNQGISKLEKLYSPLRNAKIYFTIGCMRTNGTTKDSLIMIGSELAMADRNTDISEFEGRTKDWLEGFFGRDPIDNLVFLNVHEYVHTQQRPIANNLLYQVLYEGIAEYLTVLALDTPSVTPAIAFGKSNPAVKAKFEEEMFFEKGYEWLWSNAPNEFETRDLGYFIGYEIAEKYYLNASDKKAAIRRMIELDYTNSDDIDAFIDSIGYFSRPIQTIRDLSLAKRPVVDSISGLDTRLNAGSRQLKVHFSEKLNAYNTGLNYSDLGPDAFPEIERHFWSEDSASWTMILNLEEKKHYKFWVTSNFRNPKGVPIQPYLVEFKTNEK